MHKIVIPKSVVDRVVAHRGAEHIYRHFDPARTAFLVIDMQNAFMMPGVAHALCPTAVEIVPNINRIASAMRAAGGTVVWVITTFGEKSLADWPVLHEMAGPERTARRIAALAEDNIGHRLWGGLDPHPEDLTVVKTKYSAFVQGSSPIAEILRARGIDTVIVAGTVTGVCCESTARDAMMLNFKAIMATDANAAMTDDDHNASLAAFYLSFGDIQSTDMLLERLNAAAKAA
jgi:ureidoacrylate peracid hydrolase